MATTLAIGSLRGEKAGKSRAKDANSAWQAYKHWPQSPETIRNRGLPRMHSKLCRVLVTAVKKENENIIFGVQVFNLNVSAASSVQP